MTTMDDAHLEAVLASIGPLLVLEPLTSAQSPPPWRRWWARLGVVVAALGVAVLGVAPLRGAVADWLGIGSTQVDVRPDSVVPESLPSIDAGASLISPTVAAAQLGQPTFDRVVDSALGEPSGFALVPEGGVLTVWPDGTTLWVHTADVDPSMWLQKLVGSAEDVSAVDGLGDDAIAIAGDHVLQTPHRTVAAPNTVLWTDGPLEFRLAGDAPIDDLIDTARNL